MDLLEVLPDFDTTPFSHLLYSLEKNSVTVLDLISSDTTEIARKCPLPARDVKQLAKDITMQLRQDLYNGVKKRKATDAPTEETSGDAKKSKHNKSKRLCVRTLDAQIDAALNGGIEPGHITEVVGEARTGKSTFVLGLLLAVQLPPASGGLGKAAIYVSTEAPLNTKRLAHIHECHSEWDVMPPQERPSLDHVHAATVSTMEEQDRILRYQLPLMIQRYSVGLVVLDSVAANFRAEHGTRTPAQLADRAVELTNLGNLLRQIAIEHQVAVVVTNQVSDRFEDSKSLFRSSSPATNSTPATSGQIIPPEIAKLRQETQSLDHQQRFFTGWGDENKTPHEQLKTPALGLAWANQLSARIVLKMESERQEYAGGNLWKDDKTIRTFAVVFAPWAPPTDRPIRYEIAMQGIVALPEPEKRMDMSKAILEEHADLLDEALWATDDDEEFP